MASLVVGEVDLVLFLEFLHRVGFVAIFGCRGGGRSNLHRDAGGAKVGAVVGYQ